MYLKLTGRGPDRPCRWMADWPFIDDADFDLGERITAPVPTPLEFVLEPLHPSAPEHGPELPAFFDLPVPLFRDDLLAAVQSGGVDNLQVYEAVIRERDGSQVATNYNAVNVVGLIAAADMARSKATVHPGGPVYDVEFDELVIDPAKAKGALLFRLAEATGSLFVHDRLRRHLLAAGFDELTFIEPGDAFV